MFRYRTPESDKLLERLEAELLPANGSFIHQSTFGMREYGHALVVAGILRSGGAAPCCTTTGASRACLRCSTCGNGDCTCLRAELEIAACEIVVGALVLEEDDLAIRLPTELQAYRHLRHFRRPGHFSATVCLSLAMRPADPDTALADSRKNSIAVGVLEEWLHCRRLFENISGLAVVICSVQ